jgi:hypothetical protein
MFSGPKTRRKSQGCWRKIPITPTTLQSSLRRGFVADASPACLLAAGGIGGTIGRHFGGEMTITTLIEAVVIVVVIYLAVRFFMKRG